MRKLSLAVLALVVAGLTGCGSGDSGGSPPASPSASPDEQGVKFAQCMREHGVDIPDPKPGEGIELRFGPDTDRETVDAAMEACREFSPQGGGAAGNDPQAEENNRKFAECMRGNGVESFPDPQPGQRGVLIGPEVGQDPDFSAAREKCQEILSGGS